MRQADCMVDIHCHLLPAVDDGAASVEESLAMAAMAVADGIGTIVATPHQLGAHSGNRGPSIRERVASFRRTLQEHRILLEVLPGADVRIEPELVAKIRTGDVLTLADRRRHVLLELPHEVYLPLERPLAELRAAGVIGILSHPERNLGILNNPGVAQELVDAGCLLQITAGSLTGSFGPRVRGMAESLVKQGLVHFVATDAHNTKSRAPRLRAAWQRVAELAGEELAAEVCSRNPAQVARGGTVAPGARRVQKSGWHWFWQKKAG